MTAVSEEESQKRKSQKRKSQQVEDQGARRGRKVAKHSVFPMSCGSRGSKSRLAKAAGAETFGQRRDQKLLAAVARTDLEVKVNTSASGGMLTKCTQMWRKAHFKVKMYKTHHVRTAFGS